MKQTKQNKKKNPDVTKFVKKKKKKLTELENKILDVSSLVKETNCYSKKVFEKCSWKETYRSKLWNNARLAQTHLITKTDIDVKLSSLNRTLPQINQNSYLLKNNWKNLPLKKYFIQLILLIKVILKKIEHKSV